MNFKKIYRIWKSVSEFCENQEYSEKHKQTFCKNTNMFCNIRNCPLELECYINKEDLKL